MSLGVMFIAGEDSGDQHAARVIRELKLLLPNLTVFGYGGFRMQAEGMELAENLAQKLPIIGMTQVLRNYPKLRRLLKDAAQMLEQRRPDALVLVDYPGFNLRTARVAKRLGIPVIYYISPQIWAWHKSRLKVISETVSKMLVILPFEQEFYQKAGLAAAYVGHPLQDDLSQVKPVAETRKVLGIEDNATLIGLLPGSRRSEIERHLATLLHSARLIKAAMPAAEFVIPRAATIPAEFLAEYLKREPDMHVTIADTDLKSVRAAMDFAICKSGTSTLELALLGVPMVIFYKVSALTYFVGKLVVKIAHIGLVNIVAGREVVPELIQDQANPKTISETALRILRDPQQLALMREDLAQVRNLVGGSGASQKTAAEIAAFIRNK